MKVVVLCSMILLHINFIIAGDYVNEKKLLDQISSNGYEDIPPHNVNVNIGMSIIYVEHNEEKNVLTIQAHEKYNWTDDRLAWNPSDFGGISVVRVKPYTIWIPDITLYNAYLNEYERGWTNAIVYSNGQVFWVPYSNMKVLCGSNKHKGVHNTLSCSIRLGSWTYDGLQIGLRAEGESADLTMIEEGATNLKVVSAESKVEDTYYPCCSEPYPVYHVDLSIKRND